MVAVILHIGNPAEILSECGTERERKWFDDNPLRGRTHGGGYHVEDSKGRRGGHSVCSGLQPQEGETFGWSCP